MTADAAGFFDFVQRRLVAARRDDGGAATIGGDEAPADEVIAFQTAAGQRLFADELADVQDDDDDGRVTVVASFMGLTGPSAVLPEHYSELVVDQRRERNFALGQFLDLFNHRALSHFWRAWAKYRLPTAFENDGGRLGDPFSRVLTALAGLGVAGEPVPDEAWLAMSGAMARRIRSAGSLRRIVAGIYALPIEIVELQGRWVQLAPHEQTRLRSDDADSGGFVGLGRDAVAGAAVRDLGSRFQVRVGPLDFEQFQAFFRPDGIRAAMTDTIRRAVGGNIDFALQLVLRRDAVPPLRLDDPAAPAALGQSTWLIAGPAAGDRDEAVFSSVAPRPEIVATAGGDPIFSGAAVGRSA